MDHTVFFFIIILSFCFAIGLLVFFSKLKKPATTEPQIKKEDKPFVFSSDKPFAFSSDKPFIFSRKYEKPETEAPKIKKPEIKPEIKIEQKPPVFSRKIEPPEIQTQKSKKEERPTKIDLKPKVASGKSKRSSKKNDIDFDHLSTLIEDFFDKDKE